MLKATLAEFVNDNRTSAQYIALELLQHDTTIGRLASTPGSNHLHVGGRPEFLGLSRIQATILRTEKDGAIALELIDGSPSKKSERGILKHGRKVDRIPLTAGVEVDVFNNGTAHILLYVTEEMEGASNPTARQEDLLTDVREHVEGIKEDIEALRHALLNVTEQVGQCVSDLADRKQADARQDRRINQLAVGALGAIAGLCLVFWASERVKIDPAISVALIAAVGAGVKSVLDKKL